jgi:hypothetical protein
VEVTTRGMLRQDSRIEEVLEAESEQDETNLQDYRVLGRDAV